MRPLILFAYFVAYHCLSCQQNTETTLLAATRCVPSATDSLKWSTSNTKLASQDIIFQSEDGGKNWQNLSEGLPMNFNTGRCILLNHRIVIASYGEGIYQRSVYNPSPAWKKEHFVKEKVTNVFPLKSGLVIRNPEGILFQEFLGSGAWVPVFRNIKNQVVNYLYENETALFAGSNHGILASMDGGASWELVYNDDHTEVYELLETRDGALIAHTRKGIVVSTDGGRQWKKSTLQKNNITKVGKTPNGIFALVSIPIRTNVFDTQMYQSTDNGDNWIPIGKDVLPFENVSDFVQTGNNLLCSHKGGVSVSGDQGKNWELTYKMNDENQRIVFILAKNSIYAIVGFSC